MRDRAIARADVWAQGVSVRRCVAGLEICGSRRSHFDRSVLDDGGRTMAATTDAKGSSKTAAHGVSPQCPSKVETHFLAADAVDRARALPIEPVWRAVALFNGVAPASLPRGFFESSSLEEAIDYLMGRTPRDTPQRHLFLNMRCTVQALKAGELAAFPPLFGPSKLVSYDVRTPVDMATFPDWASEVLTGAGPWTPRGQSSSEGVGYWLKLTAKPALAHVIEDVDRRFGREFLAHCPRGWGQIVRYCMDKHGVSKPVALDLVRLLDPRVEHRGTTGHRKSSRKTT